MDDDELDERVWTFATKAVALIAAAISWSGAGGWTGNRPNRILTLANTFREWMEDDSDG